MNILITGIHGFIGSNLVASFVNQHSIYGVDILSLQKDGVLNTFGWNELGTIPSVDVVIHLAGKAHDTKNTLSEKEYFDINVGLTQKIFQYYLKSSASKFIIFSSVKAVADSVIEEHLTEKVTHNPQTPYGKSKLQAENYILDELGKWENRKMGNGGMGERYTSTERQNDYTSESEWGKGRTGEGLKGERVHDFTNGGEHIEKKVYILRPCMIHGPGNKGNLNLLYNISQKGYPWPLGAFENKRSLCSIQNITFVVQQLIEKDIEPGIYQVADDEALSTNELIELMASSQNKKAKIWHIPVKLIKTTARVGDFSHLPLNSERLKKLTESYVVSNQKIKKALGIEKMPVSAEDGFKKTFESFKKG